MAPDGGSDLIVVAGEALVDIVLSPGGEIAAHPGGGPFNTARTIGRLGQPVAYLGRLSDDRLGARLRQDLVTDGVRADAIVATSDPTTLALAEVTNHSATYRFYTAQTSAQGLTPEAAAGALPDDLAMLHVGTLGLVLEPLADAIEALVRSVPGDVVVALDPNCRPSVTSDPEGFRRRIGRLLRRSDVVKVSDDDLAFLFPGTPALEAAQSVLARGPAVVLLTRGADGVVVVTAAAVTPVAAPRVVVVDTIGAGDAFGGGFLAWWNGTGRGRAELADTAAVEEAAGFACRVAAITCGRAGADPPRLEDVGPIG